MSLEQKILAVRRAKDSVLRRAGIVLAQAGEAGRELGRFGRGAAARTADTVRELAQDETVRGAVRTGALTALDRMMTPPAEQTPVKDQVRDALRHGRRATAHHLLTGEAPDPRRR